MKTLYESILSSTGTGKFAYKKQIEKGEFTPELIKMLENETAYYKPKNNKELMNLIWRYIYFAGLKCSLNWIDTSEITDMRNLFSSNYITWHFNGKISDWDVSNVKDMYGMFFGCDFNGNISNWNVSNVRNMANMFYNSEFNGDISKWDVSNVENMSSMFCGDKKFNQDISKWNVRKVRTFGNIFTVCPIKPEYKPNKFR